MVSTIRWYHEMENGTEVLIKTPQDPGNPYTLDIPSVTMSDMGMYTCVARNVVGRDHAAAYLAIDQGERITNFSISFWIVIWWLSILQMLSHKQIFIDIVCGFPFPPNPNHINFSNKNNYFYFSQTFDLTHRL